MTHNQRSSYTSKLAYDINLHHQRTVPGLLTSNRIVDVIQGYLSIITFFFILCFFFFGLILLIPSILFSRFASSNSKSYFSIHRANSTAKNISTDERTTGSLSAIKTLCARSQMYRQGSGGPDYLAPLLMDRLSFLGDDSIPGIRFFTHVSFWLLRINFYLTRRIFSDQLASLFHFKLGEVAYLQARTCWFDDVVEEFTRRECTVSHDHKIPCDIDNRQARANLVVLGAGYDTRCYRLLLKERGVQMYEVDTAATQATKQRILEQAGIFGIDSINYVPCNFEQDDWLECLLNTGFEKSLPTLVLWEGVTMYLTQNAIEKTLRNVASCGGFIAFDYLYGIDTLFTPKMRERINKGPEPLLFGVDASQAEKLVQDVGLKVLDHIHNEEMFQRYLPKHYDGRPVGYLEDCGGFFLAGQKCTT